MITLEYALELARANEMAMRELYMELCKRSGHTDPTTSALWQNMAREESTHAALIRELQRAMPPDELAQATTFSVVALDRALKAVESFRARLRHDAVGIEEVYRFVLDIETGEQNQVINQLLHACPENLARVLSTELESEESDHLAGLLQHIMSHTTDPSLRERVRRLL